MIWIFLINGFLAMLGSVLAVLGGDVTTIPLVDEYLVTGMGYFWFFATLFPPMATVYAGFMVILGFELLLFTLKVFRIYR
jgi:hypothetical protein